MKFILVLIAVISLVGCEFDNQGKPSAVKKGSQVNTMCVDGVAYIRVDRGLSVKLHQDGKPYICVDTDTKVIIK